MFRLEKVFQNDDSGYILLSNFIKSLILFITIYTFVILSDYSIYELVDYKIYRSSNFFIYSILLPIIYFINSFFLKNKKEYKKNFLSFLKEDVLNIFISIIFTFAIIFIFKIDFRLEIEFIYLLTFHILVLFLIKIYFNNLYQQLIDKNIIQKNIMLVGTYLEIKKYYPKSLKKFLFLNVALLLI